MTYTLSTTSENRLLTCHSDLYALFHEVLNHRDFTVACGFRSQKDQEKAFSDGLSQKQWPNSKHNQYLSLAVDVYPYINGRMVNGDEKHDIHDICYFAGFVIATATKLRECGAISNKIRWGGDWNLNHTVGDNWVDAPHFEIY